MKLVTKVVLAGIICVTVVMSGMGFYILSETQDQMSDVISHQLDGKVEFAVSRIKEKSAQTAQIASTFARNRTIRKALHLSDSRGINQILNDLPAIYPFINYVIVADYDGSVFAVSTRDSDGRKIQGEQLLLNDLRKNPMLKLPDTPNATVGTPGADPYLSILGLQRGLTQWVTARVEKRGKIIGWVVISVDWQAQQSDMLRTVVEKLISTDNPIIAALITDAEGKILVNHQGSVAADSTSYSLDQIFNPDERVFWKGKRLQFGSMTGDVVIIYDRDSVFEPLLAITKSTIGVTLLSGLFLGCLLYLLLRHGLLARLRQLHLGSEAIGGGELSYRIPHLGGDEIGALGQAINTMASNLQKTTTSIDRLDIEIRQRERALADLAEQQFALDQHAIVAITDVQGTITYANNKFAEISGYRQEELLGQNHRILNSGYHDTEFFRGLYRTIASGEVWHGEICNKTKTGQCYWVNTTIVPFKGEDGKPQSYIAIRADITQRKLAEQAMVIAKEKAEEAVRTKSEFLASMSHEIRTPMNGVLGMLGLLLNTELDSVQRHRTLIAQSSAQSLLALINDILDFSKVDAGKLELELMDFNLRGMLGELAEACALQAQAKNLELVLDVTGVEHSMVKGDSGRLRQILTNLVGNAIKFTTQGEIVIRVDLQRYDEKQLCMNCSITDTGIGIPADKLGQLFDSFSQVDASTTRKYGGTGLGLAICKKLCELMGGEVTVSSKPGKGSCFEFNILLQTCGNSQLVMPRVDISVLNLLVVDDNATNREVLRGQLEHWGASVVEAVDGAEALALCNARLRQADTPLFDIAFLDMQMPGMDGAELGERLRADTRFNAMKLVMMTSMGTQGDAQRFAGLGFSGYFPKPATTSDLFDSLSVVAEGGEALLQAEPLVTQQYLRTLNHDQPEASVDSSARWPENTRVLLVEDNQVNKMVAVGILNDIGLQVDVAANGEKALLCLCQATDNDSYSLVLMDCQMPLMDGYEASRQIRAGRAGSWNQSIPIVAMTANAMSGDREKCLAAGMNDYLSKPVDPDLLRNKLSQWLSDSTLPDIQENESDIAASGTPLESVDIVSELELAVWDKEGVLKRILGQEELLKSLVDGFLSEFPLRLEELTQAIDEKKCDEVCRLAHGLKGMLANLSCLQLQHQSVCLESAAKKGDMDKVTQLMPGYQVASEQLIRCFEHYAVEQKEEKKQPPGSAQQLQGLLQDIAAKLQQGDYIDVEALAPLRQASDNPTVQALLHQLLGQIGLFDFPAAQQTLKEVEVLVGMKLNLEEMEVD